MKQNINILLKSMKNLVLKSMKIQRLLFNTQKICNMVVKTLRTKTHIKNLN